MAPWILLRMYSTSSRDRASLHSLFHTITLYVSWIPPPSYQQLHYRTTVLNNKILYDNQHFGNKQNWLPSGCGLACYCPLEDQSMWNVEKLQIWWILRAIVYRFWLKFCKLFQLLLFNWWHICMHGQTQTKFKQNTISPTNCDVKLTEAYYSSNCKKSTCLVLDAYHL